MARKYSNTFAETTLTGSISNSATTITIGSTTGLPPSFPYTLAIDYGTSSVEMVTVTALAGSNLTVTRGQDGTSAQSHTAGARVVHPVTARDLSEPQVHIDATSDIHGLSGGASVVGTSQSQTLTNKTISGSNNTLTNIGNTSLVAIDAAKVTQPFATMTVTGASAGAQVVTVTGDEVGRNKPIASWKRSGIGLLIDEDAVVDVSSDLSIAAQRASAASALASRLYIRATTKIGAIIQRVVSQTQDLFQIISDTGSTLFRVGFDGNVGTVGTITATGTITSGGALAGATLSTTSNGTIGGTLGVTGLLTASAGVSTTNVTASGGVTTSATGVTVASETWHAATLLNSWTNVGGGNVTAQYRKVAGLGSSVEIIGVIQNGTTTAGTAIFNLPSGYRPTNNVREPIYAFGPSMNIAVETPGITIGTTGDVTLVGTTNATILAFHCTIPLDA